LLLGCIWVAVCVFHQFEANRGDTMIRKLKSGKYRLYSRKVDPRTGKRRNLGPFDTREAAEKHERAGQYFKRQGGPHLRSHSCRSERRSEATKSSYEEAKNTKVFSFISSCSSLLRGCFSEEGEEKTKWRRKEIYGRRIYARMPVVIAWPRPAGII